MQGYVHPATGAADFGMELIMVSNGILNLTVDHLGRLRLYESTANSLAVKGPTEVNVQISLTTPQIRTILRAEQLAKSKSASSVHNSQEFREYNRDVRDPRD